MTAHPVRVTLPLKVVNESNQRGHWSARARRTKAARTTVGLVVAAHIRAAGPGLRLPLVVTLTRIAPRNLDTDGVVSALKATRDGVADALGVDDGSDRVTWLYGQRRGKPGDVTIVRGYGVEVRIGTRPDDAEPEREETWQDRSVRLAGR